MQNFESIGPLLFELFEDLDLKVDIKEQLDLFKRYLNFKIVFFSGDTIRPILLIVVYSSILVATFLRENRNLFKFARARKCRISGFCISSPISTVFFAAQGS